MEEQHGVCRHVVNHLEVTWLRLLTLNLSMPHS